MARAKRKGKSSLARTIRRERRYSIKANLASIARFKSRADVASAQKLSVIVPALKPLAKKKALTAGERQRIAHWRRKLRGIGGLKPVSKKFARRHKDMMFASGVQAIQETGASERAVFSDLGKDFTMSQNGRTYLYWHLSRETVRSKKGMKATAQKAFEAQYPIDTLQQLAAKAFKTLKPLRVYLWTNHGIAPPGFKDFGAFAYWADLKWRAGRYVTSYETRTGPRDRLDDPGGFVRGIAILIKEEPVFGGKFGAAKASEMG